MIDRSLTTKITLPVPKISIVIVSWNVAELLEDCIGSVLKAPSPGYQKEIIVVDNASSDGSPDLVRQKFPQVRLIANRHNFGFGRGCNQGWRQASGEFIFFLNPDAEIAPDTLQILLDFMAKNPQVVITGPQLRYPDGSIQSSRRRFLSPALAFVESTILQRYRPFKNLAALQRYYMNDQSDAVAQKVDWLVGAALLVRRDVLEKFGGFDERFFMYSEESDLCREAGKYGEVWYLPEAVVMHREGRSSAKAVPARHINFNSSKISYFRKWHGSTFAWILRNFLLATYLFQGAEEGIKFLLGHKRELRLERLQIVRKVLASGLRPYRSPWTHLASEAKIGLISAEYWPQPGGVGDYTACIATALCGEGAASVEVITSLSDKGSDLAPEEIAQSNNGQQASAISNDPSARDYGVSRLVSKWDWSCLQKIAVYASKMRFDVLNIQYQTGAYNMHPAINCLPLYMKWKLGNQPRPRVVTTFHDLREPYLFPKAGPLRRVVTQLLLRGSDYAIVTNSEDFARALELGVRPDRLKLIPIGSNIIPSPRPDTAQRQSWRQSFGISSEQFVIGYFGLLNRSKGVDILLNALAQLQDIDWKLMIVGGETGASDLTNNAYARELDALVQRLKLEDKIIRTGHLDPLETSRALYALDLAVLPFRDGASFRRGSLLAALAHALPVVTTQVQPLGSSGEGLPQLSHTQNCYMIEFGKSESELVLQQRLVAAIQTLYSAPELRTRLSENAERLVREGFGWPKIATALMEVYLA